MKEIIMKHRLRHPLVLLLLSFIIFCGHVHAQETVGPANGALVVAGGGVREKGIYQKIHGPGRRP